MIDCAARDALRLPTVRGVRRRLAPHQLRHSHDVIELAATRAVEHHSAPARRLNLCVTSIYLQGTDPGEMMTAHARRPRCSRPAQASTPALIRAGSDGLCTLWSARGRGGPDERSNFLSTRVEL